MKALVVGATGQTGQRIVKELVERNISVRAMVRDLAKGQQLLPKEVELVVGDVLDKKTIDKAIVDCTVLFCATGATPSFDFTAPFQVDYQGTKNLVDVAKAREIKKFVFVSSLCVSKILHPLNLFWLILYWKKQAEEYLQNSGLNYTIVRPGGLKNENNADAIVMSSADTLFEGSIARVKVAKICVEALDRESASKKIVEIIANESAPNLSYEDLFAKI
jgi:uncharacterized protein YbjT (DUF2867 family)